jgi:hypothetical protein
MSSGHFLSPSQHLSHSVERSRFLETLLESEGLFSLQVFRKGKLIIEAPFPNGVTDQGKTYMLNAAFNGVTQLTGWFLGLIAGATTPTLSNADTALTHSGWSEFLSYTESVRQTWTKVGATGNTVSGTASSVFTIGTVIANTYVNGGFVISDNTKAGTAGTLWSTGLFTNPVPVQATDVFKLGYLTGL